MTIYIQSGRVIEKIDLIELACGPLGGRVQSESIDYEEDGVRFKGYIAYPQVQGKRPAVLVCPAFYGRDAFACEKAEALAKLGYVGFAADVYGEGKTASSADEATKLMNALLEDRPAIRRRLLAALDKLRQSERIDSSRIGAIGFCFGGICALELARAGADVRGVVSLHGLLRRDRRVQDSPIKSAILVLHGYEDPLVPVVDLLTFQQEMNDKKVDWQSVVYGHAMHGFTNPDAHYPERGVAFNEKASRRAWREVEAFFNEQFQ